MLVNDWASVCWLLILFVVVVCGCDEYWTHTHLQNYIDLWHPYKIRYIRIYCLKSRRS